MKRRILYKLFLIKKVRKILRYLTPEQIDKLDLSFLRNNDLSRLIKESMLILHELNNEEIEAIK